MEGRELKSGPDKQRQDLRHDINSGGVRTYIPEKQQPGKRHWVGKEEEQEAVHENRRRLQRPKGKRVLRKRGELIERTFAHCYETGGMRRTHLRKHNNILKRLLIHVAGANLGLLLRTMYGSGTQRSLQGLSVTLDLFVALLARDGDWEKTEWSGAAPVTSWRAVRLTIIPLLAVTQIIPKPKN